MFLPHRALSLFRPWSWWLKVAVGCVLVCGGLAYVVLAQKESTCNEYEYSDHIEVVVAAAPIAAGMELTGTLITKHLLHVDSLPLDPVYEKDVEIYMGMTVLVDVPAGAMLLESDFMGPWRRQAQGIALGARAGKASGSAWAAGWR